MVKSSSDLLTAGEGVEQAVDGRSVLHDAALLDAAHKLLLVQMLPGKLKLLHMVVWLHQRLLVLSLHLTKVRREEILLFKETLNN